jgi:nucleolar MIF4G domain-containing protein 1
MRTQQYADSEDNDSEPEFQEPAPIAKPVKKAEKSEKAEEPKPKSILKTTKMQDKKVSATKDIRSPSPPPMRVPRKIQEELDEEDAKIAFLEKKLGIKSKKGLPKSFQDDGLEELLEGLGEGDDDDVDGAKSAKAEGDKWLEEKRKKARKMKELEEEDEETDEDEDEDGDEESENEKDDESLLETMSLDGDEYPDNDEGDTSDLGSEENEEPNFDDEDDFGGFDSEDASPKPELEKKLRENPYIAPAAASETPSAKYIPPSLRKASSSESESLVRLRRQIQGLVNRLTETNLISILGEIEKLYRDNPRQHVTSTLVDLLLTSVCEPSNLPDTLIILPAGFIAAVYKIIGTDFGAQVIQRIVELFEEHYTHATRVLENGADAAKQTKETSNLITLLSELYNFQVIGSNLIYDYIKLFLSTLSELNTELLLKIIRTSGPQLRQDDPSSLKDIVNMLRPAIEKVGEANMSVRTKFMIETINDLKNNKMKTGAVASAVMSEHTIRMKKTLGTLNSRTLKGSEPLRIGLSDIKDSDKKGKWWLVGASWAGNDSSSKEDKGPKDSKYQVASQEDIEVPDAGTSDLAQLAREQRMNTDIRRAIFITIMSASDFQDAHMRLMKLKLKKVQELEIPKVLIHCASAEASYNPYYTLIANRLCGDRKLKMAFQFTLWDLFKRMGEVADEDDEPDEDDEESLTMRSIVNLAKMFGTLIAEGGLTVSVLKNLSLAYLQPKTKTFVEVLFITVFLQSQKQEKGKRNETAIVNIFLRVKDTPSLITGLQYFVKKVVSKTDIAGGKAEKATVKWACEVARRTLESLAA